MISLKKNDQGFTIVELLIVIAVIGILALLVITTYAGIQAKARNAKRQSDLKSLQTQIEAFYSQNGYYPNKTDVNDDAWLKTNMSSLDINALQDPSDTTHCLGNPAPAATFTCIAGTPQAKLYAYQATQADGATS